MILYLQDRSVEDIFLGGTLLHCSTRQASSQAFVYILFKFEDKHNSLIFLRDPFEKEF